MQASEDTLSKHFKTAKLAHYQAATAADAFLQGYLDYRDIAVLNARSLQWMQLDGGASSEAKGFVWFHHVSICLALAENLKKKYMHKSAQLQGNRLRIGVQVEVGNMFVTVKHTTRGMQ